MSCCAPGTEGALELDPDGTANPPNEELMLSSKDLGNGLWQTDFNVPGIHCGGCIRTIENGLNNLEIVENARVNLSTKRVRVVWSQKRGDPSLIGHALHSMGYEAHVFDFSEVNEDQTLSILLRSLAVAGFAAANIMLLSVSVWSGAEAATRDLFHWISAMIAAPTLAYSGRVFYRSAFSALRHRRLNMDVPITLAVTLAFAMSLYETINSGVHAYFDASTMLLFFLLISRTLDHMMREKARSAVKGLARLSPRGAMTVTDDGARVFLSVDDIQKDMKILLAAGDRVPVDARVLHGISDLDCSLVSGESAPVTVSEGSVIRAGTLNLTGPMTVIALAPANQSFLSEMMQLMERAEDGKAGYRRIADRAAELYAPIVHLVALLSFLGWLYVSGDWYHATYIAIAVLIITCPCALGLAVPVVQVVAAGRMFERGIMVKDGGAMERLAEVDMVLFDKTGTLTLGQPELVNGADIEPEYLAIAAAMGKNSRHPLSQALSRYSQHDQPQTSGFDTFQEIAGAGLQAERDGKCYRLGRAEWALANVPDDDVTNSDRSQAVLGVDGAFLAAFAFEDKLRADTAATVTRLQASGMPVAIVSGDRERVVSKLAQVLGISLFKSGVLPKQKAEFIEREREAGRKVLMVGDGLNDGPALVSAHASIAPATAADVGRNAADFVFLHESLSAVPAAIRISKLAGQLIRQNFALAIIYNLIAIPSAILGYATPLVAALAMSSSSIVVVLNALRLRLVDKSTVPSVPAVKNGDLKRKSGLPLSEPSR